MVRRDVFLQEVVDGMVELKSGAGVGTSVNIVVRFGIKDLASRDPHI